MTRHDIFQTAPAEGLGERWRDATPLGNGLTGVSLYGGCRRDTYIIGRHDLWHGGRDGVLPELSHVIGEMRALIDEERWEEACSRLYDELNKAGFSSRVADMRTLGQVEFTFACDAPYSRYRRTLHMDTGEAEITYTLDGRHYRRRAFVSRKRDIIVSRLDTPVPADLTAEPGFFKSYEPNCGDVEARDRETARTRIADDCICYSVRNDDGRYFGMVCRMLSDGNVTVAQYDPENPDTPAPPRFSVTGATVSTILIKPFSRAADRERAEKAALAAVCGVTEDYDTLLKEHIRLHRRLYRTADLRLYNGRVFHSNTDLIAEARENAPGAELTEKLWRFGRYLFISGTHPKGNPFPLYGLWCAGYYRPWTQNVANENVEIIHWHAAAGGLGALLPPLIRYYCRNIPAYREVAQKLYGCRGIFVSTYTSPFNTSPAPAVPVILHFNGTAGWLSRHFYEYYLLTRDEKLLEEAILPFMVEAAAFYEDYVTEEDGQLVICPGVSPENSPAEFKHTKHPTATGHYMPVTKNPTIEFAILKELLTNLLALAKSHPHHPVLTEKAPLWREMLSKFPPYRVNADGAIAEWIDPRMTDNYEHRHLSHLYPVFPSTEIADSGRRDLIPAFRKAVELRQIGTMTGWSMAHMASIYARLGDGNKAFDTLTMLTKVCLLGNFFTLHNDYRGMGITSESMGDANFAPVQLDGIMGCVNAVQEMLLTVSENRVILLPAVPAALPKGSARLHIFGGTVALRWDTEKQTFEAVITAARPLSLTVELPFGGGEKKIKLGKGESTAIRNSECEIEKVRTD